MWWESEQDEEEKERMKYGRKEKVKNMWREN